ncbi:DUF7331 family protein [Natronorubrum thiooxidans]
MYHGNHNQDQSCSTHASELDRLACLVSFTVEDGSAVIYDVRQPTAWISSDHPVPIESAP